MLEAINLKNYLFFENIELALKNGLNIFTGETGAGKSILVEAIKLALGARCKNNIHLDKTKAVVISLKFTNLSDNCINFIKNAELGCEFDNEHHSSELIIRRSIASNHSSKYFVNDILCTQKLVREIGYRLVEFTSQNSTLALYNSNYQREIVDSFVCQNLLHDVNIAYKNYCHRKKHLEEFIAQQKRLLQEEDYLKFVTQELEVLNVLEDEENILLDKIKLLKKQRSYSEGIETIELESNKIRTSLNALDKSLIKIDAADFQNQSSENLAAIGSYLEEFDAMQNKFKDEFLQVSQQFSLEVLEDRLYLLREHSRKYRVPVCALNSFLLGVQEKLSNITNSKDLAHNLEKKLSENKIQYLKLAKQLYNTRLDAAKTLSNNVNKELEALKMEGAIFLPKISHIENKYSAYGADDINFEIKTNSGKDFELLKNIASGGELSRIMLAIKSSIKSNHTFLYIFDEIDTGISGSVSTMVGKKLKYLSNANQLIVITHQPQVAVFADSHFVVYKSSNCNKTQVSFSNISDEEKVVEIARMLSGSTISDASKNAAKSLISQL